MRGRTFLFQLIGEKHELAVAFRSEPQSYSTVCKKKRDGLPCGY
jgi:hypothetical protein